MNNLGINSHVLRSCLSRKYTTLTSTVSNKIETDNMKLGASDIFCSNNQFHEKIESGNHNNNNILLTRMLHSQNELQKKVIIMNNLLDSVATTQRNAESKIYDLENRKMYLL